MTSTRTYGEACASAHALDLIGERWALLVVRELLFGPKRFSDLRAGLPAIGPNRLAQRLRELERHEVVRRRKLAPPAGSWVYELTDWGRELEPILIQLGQWGRRSPFRDLTAHISADSLMLAVRGDFHPQPGDYFHATYTLRFNEDHFTVRVADTRIEVTRGHTDNPDVTIDTDIKTFVALLTRTRTPHEAIREGRLAVSGDTTALDRLLNALPRPEPTRTSHPSAG